MLMSLPKGYSSVDEPVLFCFNQIYCVHFLKNYENIANYPDKAISSWLQYVTPPAGSSCLTRKTKTVPTGTYCAEI